MDRYQSRPRKDPELRSNEVTEGPERASHRSMFRATGYVDEDLASPMVGVANPVADVTPCEVHLDDVAASAIAGASLDVFETKPLPEVSPLRDLDEGIVTPHCAGTDRDYWRGVAAIVRENVDRVRDGEEMTNRVV